VFLEVHNYLLKTPDSLVLSGVFFQRSWMK